VQASVLDKGRLSVEPPTAANRPAELQAGRRLPRAGAESWGTCSQVQA